MSKDCLKAGDLIKFEDGSKIIIGIGKNGDGLTVKEIEKNYAVKIKKVVRPNYYKKIYERKKEILDDAERRYLKAVIRPFKDKVEYITKEAGGGGREFIHIEIAYFDSVNLPYFEKGTMYKEMKLNNHYTLKELGLYE